MVFHRCGRWSRRMACLWYRPWRILLIPNEDMWKAGSNGTLQTHRTWRFAGQVLLWIIGTQETNIRYTLLLFIERSMLLVLWPVARLGNGRKAEQNNINSTVVVPLGNINGYTIRNLDMILTLYIPTYKTTWYEF